jgi:hypothetical protein
MSTATEIMLHIKAAEPRVESIRRAVGSQITLKLWCMLAHRVWWHAYLQQVALQGQRLLTCDPPM